MPDISESKQSEVTRITDGEENNTVGVSSLNDIYSLQGIPANGLDGALTVGTSAVEVKVGANRLTDRRLVTIHNNSNQTIFWGFSGVTTSTGTPIEKGEFIAIQVRNDSVALFLISSSTNLNVRIKEA